LLLLGLYAAHRTQELLNLLSDADIDVIFVPGGCTSLLQLHDVALNKAFKYQETFWNWRGCRAYVDGTCPTPTREKVTKFVAKALNGLDASQFKAPFGECIGKYLVDDLPLFGLSSTP
jgi:hypothetical protein